jgi:hypothetical protein
MIEKMVERFGEEYRRLIVDSLTWLDRKEAEWCLDEPINREAFLVDLISRVSKTPELSGTNLVQSN